MREVRIRFSPLQTLRHMLPSVPEQSAATLGNIDLSSFQPLQNRLDLYASYDREHESGDPSNCRFLGKLQSGVVLGCAKLAIDGDGIAKAPGFRSGTQLDPADGQNDTSFHIGGRALSSEKHPFYVLPGGLFRQQSGLELGDLCVVVYNGCISAAVFGDIGPWDKLGEGSIFLHEGLAAGGAPDPCSRRNPDGSARLIRNSSISGNVIFVGFPKSAIPLDWDEAPDQIREAAYGLLAALRKQADGTQ